MADPTPLQVLSHAIESLARGFSTCPLRPLYTAHTAQEMDEWWMRRNMDNCARVTELAQVALSALAGLPAAAPRQQPLRPSEEFPLRAPGEHEGHEDADMGGPTAIYLSDAQWDHFMETMSNPAEPTEAMKQGLRMMNELRAQRAALASPAPAAAPYVEPVANHAARRSA